jgi:hypothetical protein
LASAFALGARFFPAPSSAADCLEEIIAIVNCAKTSVPKQLRRKIY